MERIGLWLLEPFLDPASRTWWPSLLVAAVVTLALGGAGATARSARHPSAWLDVQLLVGRQLLRGLGALPVLGAGLGVATQLVRLADATVGAPDLGAVPSGVVVAGYTLTLFVVWDASRYVLHRLMHEVPVLWELHQVHHSAEVLTPLTFHRIHPAESLLYAVRGWFVTAVTSAVFFWAFRDTATIWTIAGVHGVGFLLNLGFGNLRHSHVWISFGRLEQLLVSPAQHQLHHALDHDRTNYGTWLSIWDRLGGTFQASGAPPQRFGIAQANHRHTLLSAWTGPLVAIGRRVAPRWKVAALAAAGLLLGARALAAEPGEGEPSGSSGSSEPTDSDDADARLIVRAEWETPGSVNVVDEEQLARFERDDIGAVLGQVPGVTVREEDGFGLRPNIGLRGVSSERSAKVTLLEDGVLLAPAPYSAPAAYYFPMVTRMVGIEVSKGPASIQNGPSTVGGAVNLISRDLPEGSAGYVDLAAGLRRSAKLHAWAGSQGEHLGVLIEAVGLRTDGFKHLDDGGPTGFDRGEAMLKARWRSAARGSHTQAIELKLGYAAERSHETYLGLSTDDFADDPYRRYAASSLGLMQWHRWLGELRIPVRLGNVQIETTAYRHDLHRSWTKFNRFEGDVDVHDLLSRPAAGQSAVYLAVLRGDEDSQNLEQTLLIGTNDRQFRASGVQSRLTLDSRVGRATSRLEAGLRLHSDAIDRLHTEDPYQMRDGALVRDEEPTRTVVDGTARARAIAGYLHEDLILGAVHLVPGLRVESIWNQREDSDDPDWVHRTIALPGLGVLVDLTPDAALFTGLHRGFSPVPPGEDPETGPETSWNLEGGVRLRGPRSAATALGYVNDYLDLTDQCGFSVGCSPEAAGQQYNAGRAWVYGAEVQGEHTVALSPSLELPIRGTWTWTEGRFRTDFDSAFPQFGEVSIGDYLPYVARHQLSAQVGLSHRRFDVAASVRHRTPMLDVAGPFEDAPIPSLTVLDVAASVAITDGLTVYATGSNLTGASPIVSLRPFGARPPAPLQIMAGIKARTAPR